jgi:hypothetical protein
MSPAVRLGQRIKEIRKSLPPPENRTKRSALNYPSQEEFADLLTTDRWRVIDWENNGTVPERRFREQISDLAGLPREELEAFVDEMRGQRGEYVARLERRISDLETNREKDRAEYFEQLNALREELARLLRPDDEEGHQEDIAI